MSAVTNRLTLVLAATAIALLAFAASAAAASAAPRWAIKTAVNTTVAPGDQLTYLVSLENVGDGPTNGSQFDVTIDLPEGITPISVATKEKNLPPYDCSSLDPGSSEPFTCSRSEEVAPGSGSFLAFKVLAQVSLTATGTPTASFEISGGSAGSASTLAATRIAASPAGWGIGSFDAAIRADEQGTPYSQAGGHPYALDTGVLLNTLTDPDQGDVWPAGSLHDLDVELPPGLVGNPTAAGQCTAEEAAQDSGAPACPPSSQVGTVFIRFNGFPNAGIIPVYNMVPPTGVPARLLFSAAGTLVTLDAKLRSDGDYGLTVSSTMSPEAFALVGAEVRIWGDPSDPIHDPERGCPGKGSFGCTTERTAPFLRLPTKCTPEGEGLAFSARADSWEDIGAFDSSSMQTHLPPNFPALPEDWGAPRGTQHCDAVPVKAELQAQPTAIDAETPSGLNVHVEVPNPGLESAGGTASSDIEKVRVALPEGMTVNPSQAEGLGVCTEQRFQSSQLSFFPTPGSGCPEDSKIGSVNVKTPLLAENIPGDVYIAEPYNNRFGSLLALYVVLREPNRGVMVKLAGKVETDEATGQVVAIFDDLPQLPFDSFDFKFREGARAPLVTPQSCGTYTTSAQFTGYSNPGNPITRTSSFEIARGIGGGPCPSGGTPAFKPGLIAGSVNNNAGAFSPFNLRLFRNDGEQEFTHFSVKLPPGLSGKLAGVPFCPDAAIEAAKARTGAQEILSPSCPVASEVGRTLVGAGVGPVLAYAPGKIYLAGPYNGSALSIAAITAAKVGPFDLGTVVVREALKVNPKTAEVFIDATGSDPIPHIIKGVTVHLRDIRAYVDRPDFTLNPTSCDPTSVASTVLGSGLDFASAIDDQPVTVTTRYQAANCANLGFKPKLKLSLRGATKRTGFPALRAELRARPGDANIGRVQVEMPHSEFIAQSHLGTSCTRVQFNSGAGAGEGCPANSVYGYARAWTPLLDEPLEGPVFLRSNGGERALPDLVASLRGLIDIELEGQIDSKNGGGIRTTFEAAPDAPVTKFILSMRGGEKGLLENSQNLCHRKHRAVVKMDGHNGKAHDFKPLLKANCASKGKRKR